jgi:crossover junction endodeoxyribonuclease RuvC
VGVDEPQAIRILGVDPGSVATGYGIVERVRGTIVHVAHGTIRPPARAPLAERLAHIQRDLQTTLIEYAPHRAAVESVFVSVNARSALVLGQARGAILATLGTAGVPVDELATRTIKKAVTGMGGAEKDQVQAMVSRLLGLERPPAQDAADALAVALCRAQMRPMADLRTPARGRRRPRTAARRAPGPVR